MFQVPLDLLRVYQYSWNTQKLELAGTNKMEALLKQRQQIWRHIDKWLHSVPRRNGCALAGDFNTPLFPAGTVARPGVATTQPAHQQDQGDFLELLKTHSCCALNAWARRGPVARMFIPPNAQGKQSGTQIDFASLPIPVIPRGRPTIDTPLGCRPHQVQRAIADPDMAQALGEVVRPRLASLNPTDDIDQVLLDGWGAARNGARARLAPSAAHTTLTASVRQLWELRAVVKRVTQGLSAWTAPPRRRHQAFQAWLAIARLNRFNRELRKECRRRKTNKIEEVVRCDNIHQAAKRFAPKAPRRRLQLRAADGGIQTHEAEFEQIKTYFVKLYAGPQVIPTYLSQCPLFSTAEMSAALRKLQAGKAMPGHSAPAALWKLLSKEVAPLLAAQLNLCLSPGATFFATGMVHL